MPNTYFIADTHLFYNDHIAREMLPFKDMDELIECLVERWNSQVQRGDTVEILGDFSNGTYKQTASVLDRLNGNKNIIIGNHDNIMMTKELLIDGYYNQVTDVGKIMLIDDFKFKLTHYPLDLGARTDIFNIHGHLHSRPSILPNQFNLSVKSPLLCYKEIFHMTTIEELIILAKERFEEINHYYDGFEKSIFGSPWVKKRNQLQNTK